MEKDAALGKVDNLKKATTRRTCKRNGDRLKFKHCHFSLPFREHIGYWKAILNLVVKRPQSATILFPPIAL